MPSLLALATHSSDALHRCKEEQERLLAARSGLANRLSELSQIEKKLLQTQNRLTGIDQKLPLIQAAMAPIKNKAALAKGLSAKLEGALERASEVLEIFDAISAMERKLAAEEPESDLRKYLAMVCRMERYLESIRERYTPSVECLEEVVRFVGRTKSMDAYNLQKLNDEVVESKRMDPWEEMARKDPLREAMQKLEAEFRRLLSGDVRIIDLSLYVDDDASSSTAEQKMETVEFMSRDTINKLLVISDRLNANGRIGPCLKLYKVVRTRVAQKSMARLHPAFLRSFSVESLNAAKWESIQDNLYTWIADVKVIVSFFMSKERELCDQVFHALDPADRISCFADIVKQSNMSVFFRYAEAVASVNHRSEAVLVGLLHIVGGLISLEPDLLRVFEGCKDALNDFNGMKRIVARNAYRVFWKLVKDVETRATEVPIDGGKDMNASFVVNYMGMIMRDYKGALQEVLELQKKGSNSELSLQIAALTIMEALEKSLEGRATKLYEDHILAHIFRMNNYNHVLTRLKDCTTLSECIGDDFKAKWSKKVELHQRGYMTMSWEGAMGSLSRDPSLQQQHQMVKARMRSFNQAFEEIYRQQCRWIIIDPTLRERVQRMILEKLLPAYNMFIKSYGAVLDEVVLANQRVNRYSADDLESMVMNLFIGVR